MKNWLKQYAHPLLVLALFALFYIVFLSPVFFTGCMKATTTQTIMLDSDDHQSLVRTFRFGGYTAYWQYPTFTQMTGFNNPIQRRLVTAVKYLHPTEIWRLGDQMDYLAAEYPRLVAETNQAMLAAISPSPKIFGLKGNHEACYLPWAIENYHTNPIFYDDLYAEVAMQPASVVLKNASTCTLKTAASFMFDSVSTIVNGHSALFIKHQYETVDEASAKYDVVTVQRVKGKTIKFSPPLQNNYSSVDFFRQGKSNCRANTYLKNAYVGTDTFNNISPTNVNYYHRIGNILVIFVGLNHWSPQLPTSPDQMLPFTHLTDGEWSWLMGLVVNNYKTCNIIICTHEPPGTSADIGYPSWYNDWQPDQVQRWKELCMRYHVAMVLSGHIHMSWPYSVSQRQSQLGVYYPPAYGGTAIVIAPAAGAGAPIKQVIAAVGLTEGSSALTLSAYTMAYDGSSISLANTQTISLPHPVTFRALQ